MILEIILGFIIGIGAGTFTGLVPGVHINLVAALLVASVGGGLFAGVPVLALVTFIVAMTMAHTLLDFIPSVFLGAPSDDTALTVLPGHELLLQGKGHEAVVATLYGCLLGIPLLLIYTGVFILFLPTIFSFVKSFIAFILLFVSCYLIFREKDIVISLFIFLFSGFLGWFTFHLPVKDPLLPLLSGLFGISGLLLSLSDKVSLPEQQTSTFFGVRFPRSVFLRSLLGAGIAGPLCSFLPGIGSGHASVIGSEIQGNDRDPHVFLMMVGAINVLVMGLSFVAAYSIEKTRTGSAAAILDLLGTIRGIDLTVILAGTLLAVIVSFLIGIFVSHFFARFVMKIPYALISGAISLFIVIMVIVFSNWIGLIVLATGTLLGIFCILSGSKRIQMMGCLLVPAITYYLTV